MEGFGGDLFGGVNFTIRKRRSSLSSRPISDLQKFSERFNILLQSPPRGCNDREHSFRETTIYSDGLRSENKLKKLKLKLGGVTHTIHTKYASESSPNCDVPQPQDNSLLEDLAFRNDHSSRALIPCENVFGNETFKHESVRKSRRVPKRRILDIGINEDDDDADEEIRYLGRLNRSKFTSHARQQKDEIYAEMNGYGLSNLGKEGVAKLRTEKLYEDEEYMEDEEPLSDNDLASKSKKMGVNEGKSKTGAGWIEFPDGLPSIPKKQKAKLSEVEQQVKKAEMAQRRRIQSEKAAREAEAEAIRKILGQDSARKKKEDKMKKLHDELAQGRAASRLGSNTIRWICGPAGTSVIFSDDIGLPSLFNSLPCSYPPPREKCAGPNCTNVYKYRDSKSKLPLCSLHCYKAIQGKVQAQVTC
ncbi:HIT zinc finger PAPA-1-like conserved region [Euphorbia peplus]|nr:HIT zinc finger PAPA-1-like conserved region [Euphorbia peplus]